MMQYISRFDRSSHSWRDLKYLAIVLVWPFKLRSKSPVSIYHILMVPSSDAEAIWVNCGWNANELIVDLCPFSSNFAGIFGMYISSILIFAACLPAPPPLANSSSRLCTFYYKFVIFFCRLRIDFHLISNLFPYESMLSSES